MSLIILMRLPCFHRPCHFPTIEINDKGKQKRRYFQKDMKTPFEKLTSLEHAGGYLKDGLTIKLLLNSSLI